MFDKKMTNSFDQPRFLNPEISKSLNDLIMGMLNNSFKNKDLKDVIYRLDEIINNNKNRNNIFMTKYDAAFAGIPLVEGNLSRRHAGDCWIDTTQKVDASSTYYGVLKYYDGTDIKTAPCIKVYNNTTDSWEKFMLKYYHNTYDVWVPVIPNS